MPRTTIFVAVDNSDLLAELHQFASVNSADKSIEEEQLEQAVEQRDTALRQGGYNPDEDGDEIYEPMMQESAGDGASQHAPYAFVAAHEGDHSSGSEELYEVVESTPHTEIDC